MPTWRQVDGEFKRQPLWTGKANEEHRLSRLPQKNLNADKSAGIPCVCRSARFAQCKQTMVLVTMQGFPLARRKKDPGRDGSNFK
jgi:hypothetical protein